MNFSKYENYFLSSDKINNIHYVIYTPNDVNPKGIIQIIHGMCEYFERYERFAGFLCGKGYVVCGHDQLGHGKSVSNEGNLGFFADKDGDGYLIEDTEKLRCIIREKYRFLPYIMFGHSMGSFVLREYVTEYKDGIDGIVLCGTSAGDNLPVGASMKLLNFKCNINKRKYNDKLQTAICKILDMNMADKHSWLTTDEVEVEKNKSDKLCRFSYTNAAYRDILNMLYDISQPEWANDVPKNLQILIISGGDDPVGNMGKGASKVYDRLKDAEIDEVELKIYEGARHELVNEKNREEVFADVAAFCDKVVDGVVECRTMNFER